MKYTLYQLIDDPDILIVTKDGKVHYDAYTPGSEEFKKMGLYWESPIIPYDMPVEQGRLLFEADSFEDVKKYMFKKWIKELL